MDGRFLNANPATAQILGYDSPTELMDRVTDIRRQLYADAQERDAVIAKLMNGETLLGHELEFIRGDGQHIWVAISAHVIRDQGDRPRCLQGFLVDITKRKRAEADRAALEVQLLQAQKMQSIGLLAGGVAHDFNNLLSPIIGFTDLMLLDLPPGDPMRDPLVTIGKAAERGRDLVRQLLAFGRKQVLRVEIVDLRKVVTDFESMLRRALRESIRITVRSCAEKCLVLADVGQLEQILMNLAVNAQDAMPTGGELTIEIDTVLFDNEESTRHLDMRPGPCVVLAMSDTGVGMDRETLVHAFEPFFTTKERGKGTGLGLSTVFGIVKQHDGGIFVYSEPGKGTTFKVYFPRQQAFAPQTEIVKDERLSFSSSATILVVDDDDMVRQLCTQILQRLGFRVIAADGPEHCLEIVEQLSEPVDLLLTDVVMPRMDGRALYAILLEKWKGLRVLFMSGYTSDVIVHHGILDDGIAFIQKPLSVGLLAEKIRLVLKNGA
jgi:PAS domain S-box-containing protein